MRNIFAITKRELLSFFVSPLAYFVITGFILLAGYFFSVLLLLFDQAMAQFSQMSMMRPGGTPPNLNQVVVEQLFGTMIVVLVFLVPLLTMRMVAEERKKGTFELLITSPLSVREIVLGKFLSIAIVLFVMMLGIFLYPLILVALSDPGPEFYPILSGLLGLTLCAMSFASIGMAVSSYTENQMVAGVSSMVTLLILYVIHSPAQSIGGIAGDVLTYLSPIMQAREMLQGVISLHSVVYFLSLTVLGVFLTERVLEATRWR